MQDGLVAVAVPKRFENAVLKLIGELMDQEEKPFAYCCKCFADCHADGSPCMTCGKWTCKACCGQLQACCPEMQASIDEHYGPAA
jgi:hypothetical protein